MRFLILLLLFYPNVLALLTNTPPRKRVYERKLDAVRPNERDDKGDMQGIKGMKGYYKRPSRAIERGGGFFVPGLEGERIRLLTVVALVALFSVNNSGQVVTTFPQVVSETVGLTMAFILFLQGAAELFPDEGATIDIEENPYLPPAFVSVRQSKENMPGVTTLEAISRSILQTCVSVAYVAVVSSTGEVLVELGPVARNASLMTIQDGALLSNIAKQTTTEGLDKTTFFSTVASVAAHGTDTTALLACVPATVNSLALRRGEQGNVWLIGSSDINPVDSLEGQINWVDSLVMVPFV